MRGNLLLPILMAFVSLAHAADPAPAPHSPPFILYRVNGQPLRIRFNDGREAEMRATGADSGVLSATMTVIDNTCSHRQNMNCELQFQIRQIAYQAIWIRHPEISKLGQVLIRISPNQNEPTVLDTQDGLVSHMFDDPANWTGTGLINPKFTCTDFSFLPGGQTLPPAKLHVSRWTNIDNNPNPETGFNETRSSGSMYGIDLVRSDSHSLSFQKAGSMNGQARASGFGAFGTSQTLSMTTLEGESCIVGMSSDLIPIVTPYFSSLTNRNWSAPYLWGQSPSTDRTLGYTLRNWFPDDDSAKDLRFK